MPIVPIVKESLGGVASPVSLGTFAGGLRAETPLSPVHLKARRTAAGAIDLSWIRRSRVDADTWQGLDVPLDEAVEAYRVEILDGAEVRRGVEVGERRFSYPLDDELADFGAVQGEIRVRVRQLGRLAEGIAAEADLVVG